MIVNGNHFVATIKALDLEGVQRRATEKNAADIVAAISKAYGLAGRGKLNLKQIPRKPITGLVYGRIQSGKTRAMIASTAMAFDNGFRISVVLTSNINDLVAQTHFDFSSGLDGVKILRKDDALDQEVDDTRLYLEKGNGCLLIVCSKGAKSLRNVSSFLEDIDAIRYPSIIFDDEGDQASLDTNTRKRATSAVRVAPSAINKIIQERLRPALRRHVYVSVTGTPQAVLLQSAESSHRPSFIRMLPPGDAYVGGNEFFNEDEPEDNERLITLVDRNERRQLLRRGTPIPAGLRSSILFFLVSAAAAIKNIGLPPHGYSYLCHPSLKNDEQGKARDRISAFLTEVLDAVLENRSGNPIIRDIAAAHKELKATLGAKTPRIGEIKEIIKRYLPLKKVLVINAVVKRQGIAYGKGLNFLIGGNTLGRGIAIRDLLVTYYIREAKISQIDTMHQHARMYGYRSVTIGYTRLFVPRHLYYRFRDIYRSDEDLRVFIEQHKDLPATFPIEYTYGLRATRPGVLDVRKIDTIIPGKQIFPNHIVVPQKAAAYRKVFRLLCEHFGLSPSKAGLPQLERLGRRGVRITSNDAAALARPIRTHSQNIWHDRTISEVIRRVAAKSGGVVMLRFRSADRTVGEDGFLSTGTLFSGDVSVAQQMPIPTLWIMSVKALPGSAAGVGTRFMYPTFVVPGAFRKLFMYNRGQ